MPSGSAMAELAGTTTRLAKPPRPTEASTRSPMATPRDIGPDRHDVPGHLAARHEGEQGLHLVLPRHEEAVHVVHPCRLDGNRDLTRAGLGVRAFLHPQDGGRTELIADGGAHGSRRYRRPVDVTPPIRTVRPEELALLPAIEAAADTVFEPLGIGPLPGPGAVEDFAAALVVLVAGDPPVGLCRIDALPGVGGATAGAHLEQLSVHPDHARHGLGRALLRAGCAWAAAHGYPELTLATYRDVPWNGPFYASEGFRRDRAGRRLHGRPRSAARGARHVPLRRPRPDVLPPVSSA